MGLSRCLYCGAWVSDSAASCPGCGKHFPTNLAYKRGEEIEKADAEKREAISEFRKKSTIPCKDCGNPVPLDLILDNGKEVGSRYPTYKACSHCGCTENLTRCALCKTPARGIEIIDGRFLTVCFKHQSFRCGICRKMVFNGSLMEEFMYEGPNVSACPECRGVTARIGRVFSRFF